MGLNSSISPFESRRVVQAFLDYYHLPEGSINALSLRKTYSDICDESVDKVEGADSRHAESLRSFFRPLGEHKIGDVHRAYKRFLAGGRNCPEESPGRIKYDLQMQYNMFADLEIFTRPLARYFLLSKDQRTIWGLDKETRARNIVPIKILVMQANMIGAGLDEGTIGQKYYEVFRIIGEMISEPHARRKQDVLMDLLTSKDRMLGIKLLHMISWYEAAQNEDIKPTFEPQFEELVQRAGHYQVDRWHNTLLSHFGEIVEKMQTLSMDEHDIGKDIASFPSEENEADARFNSLLYLVSNSRFDLATRFLRIIDVWKDKSFDLLDSFIHITAHLAASNRLNKNQRSLIESIIGKFEMYVDGNLSLNDLLKTTSLYIPAFLDTAELKRMDEESPEQYSRGLIQRHSGKLSGSGGASPAKSPAPSNVNPPPSPASAGNFDTSEAAIEVIGFEVVGDQVDQDVTISTGSPGLRPAQIAAVHNTMVGAIHVYYQYITVQNVLAGSPKTGISPLPIRSVTH